MFIPILTILYDYDCYLVEGTKAKLKYLLQVTISGVIGFTVMYAWIALVVAIGYYVFFIKLGWVR